MKTGNSDNYLKIIKISNLFYQIRYNISEVIDEDHTTYNYDYIEVKSIDNGSILAALIENGFSGDPESLIAEILQEAANNPPGELVPLIID